MKIGEKINERYRVLKALGRGGMAQVTLVEDLNLKRNVAMKTIRLDKSSRKTYQQRFRREAKTCSLVKHPNVIAVYDFGTLDNGAFFYTMEYLPYPTLSDILDKPAKLRQKRALSFVRQLAEALVACHANGIVHRDVKASNIIVKDDDTLILADFGLVADLTNTRITQTGDFVGTPLYLPPEALTNREIDSRSDIYQLGLIFHELLTGRTLIKDADSLSGLLSKIADEEFDPGELLSDDVPQKWLPLLESCLARDVNERLSSAQEFIDILDGKLVLESCRVKSSKEVTALPSFSRNAPFAVVFLILFLTIFVLSSGSKEWSFSDLEIKPAAKSTKVSWKSDEAYQSRVHIHGGDFRFTTNASTVTTCLHEVTVWGLKPNTKYELRIVFPNGESSLPNSFVTRDGPQLTGEFDAFKDSLRSFIDEPTYDNSKRLKSSLPNKAIKEAVELIGERLSECRILARHKLIELTQEKFQECDQRYLTLLDIVLHLAEQHEVKVITRAALAKFVINSVKLFNDYRHAEDRHRQGQREIRNFSFKSLGIAGRPDYFKLMNTCEKRMQKWIKRNGQLPPTLRLLHSFQLTHSLLPSRGAEQARIVREQLEKEKKPTEIKDVLIALSLINEVRSYDKKNDYVSILDFDKVCFAAVKKFTPNWTEDKRNIVIWAVTEAHVELIEQSLEADETIPFEKILAMCMSLFQNYKDSPILMVLRTKLLSMKDFSEEQRRQVVRAIDREIWSP